MENEKKIWTEDDINFLEKNYSLKGSQICSIELKRNKKAVIAKAIRLGIKSNRVKYRYSKEILEPIIKKSKNIREALDTMGLRAAGGNYQVINKYIKQYELDIKHFEEFEIERIKKFAEQSSNKKISLKLCLIEHSNYDRTKLKKRLYSEGLKKRECELCGQGEEWMGKKMSLILDHENGVHNDNRLENLRIVCPNCNATLDTHAGKNVRHK